MSSSTTSFIPIPSARSSASEALSQSGGLDGGASSNLSSSFPGAIKTIQLYQLQKRHSNLIQDKDASQVFINCNVECTPAPTSAAPCTKKKAPPQHMAPPMDPKQRYRLDRDLDRDTRKVCEAT